MQTCLNLQPKHLSIGIFVIKKPLTNGLNEYFVNVRPKVSGEIPQLQRSFKMYLEGSDGSFEEVTLSDEEMKTAFFPLKGGKSPGFNEINYNVKQKFNYLLVPLKYIFDLSLKSGTLPEEIKIPRVTPGFKSGDTS